MKNKKGIPKELSEIGNINDSCCKCEEESDKTIVPENGDINDAAEIDNYKSKLDPRLGD